MDLSEKTKFLLRAYRIFPKKMFGQHFLIEDSILQSMVDYASLRKNDVALDIGAGLGFLTRLLAEKCGNVLAVESDVKLVKVLCEQLRELSNVKIIEGNILRMHELRFSKVVSIPPYNISSKLLLWLFRQKFDSAVFVFQKEFASRLIASSRSENYGWLSVLAYYHADIELLDDVPRWMFYPPPEVDSIIVFLRAKAPPFPVQDETLFRQFLQSLFTHRNRKVRNALASFVRGKWASDKENLLKRVESSFLDKRVRELAPEDFEAIFNGFFE